MFNVKFNEAIDAARFVQEQLRDEFEKRDPQDFYLTFDDFEKIMACLVKSIETGGSMRNFCKSVEYAGIKLPYDASETFYMTSMSGFHAAARWEQFIRHADNRPYLIYDCISDSRSRRGHRAANDIIRHVSDTAWDTIFPPNGVNCRCSVISLTEEQALTRSKNRQGLKKGIPKSIYSEEWSFHVGKDLNRFIQVGFFDLAKHNTIYQLG